MKKNFAYIAAGIIIIAGIGAAVYFKGLGQKTEETATNDLLNLKIFDERLPAFQVEALKAQFATAVAAVEKNPDSYNDWITIGIVKKQVNDYEGARVVWEKAAVLRPAGSLPLFNLGNLYADFLNNPAKAEEYYLKALANSPDLVQAYVNLADLYKNKLNQPEKIDPLITAGLAKTSDDPTLHAYLGGYYRDLKNWAKAIEYYEKILAVRPDDAIIKEELVNLRAKLR